MSSTPTPETAAAQNQQQAEIYLTEGKLEEAKTACLVALQLQPDFPPACDTLGKVLQAMDQIESAREYFHKAIARSPKMASAYINLGHLYVGQKQWDLAIACYQKAVQLEPNNANLYQTLAKTCDLADKAELGAAFWYRALTLEPKLAKPWEHLELGNTLLKYGKVEEAIACYGKTIELNPKISQAYHNLGEIYSDRLDWEKAITNYSKAVELNPEGVWSQYGLGKAFAWIGKWEEAITYYRQAGELKPETAVIYHSLGDALVKQKLLAEAINSYQKALEIQPETWVVYHKLGNALQEKGELEEAIASYYQTIQLKPDFVWSYYSLAEALFQLKRWDEAVAAYLFLLNLKDFPELHISLEFALQKIAEKDLQATIKFYRDAVVSNSDKQTIKLPSDEQCYLQLGNALAKIDRYNGAIVLYNMALALKPKAREISAQLQKVLAKKRGLQEEVASYREAIINNPNGFLNYYKLAEILQELQRWDEAAATYIKAIKIKPEYPWFFYYSNLLNFLLEEGKIEPVLKFYRQFNKNNPDAIWGYINQGEILTQKDNIKGAIACYQTACLNKIKEFNPEFVEKHWDFKNAKGPDYIIIGSQKSGTTSLENYISQHPQVLPAVKKETHFWYRDFDKGIDWYLAHFPPIPKSLNYLTGEATPNYLENWKSAQRIKEAFPKIKLLLIIRNPIDRAFSQYNHWIRLRWENRSFEEAIKSEIEILEKNPENLVGDRQYWNQTGNYLGRGIYLEFIKKWLEIFPREQLLILRGEDLYQEPSSTMKQVFEFLGLPPEEGEEYRKLNVGSYSPISQSMRDLLNDYFQPHNQKLEDYLGMEFNWN
ncbi:MAG: tetratricopeptide repeat protein [Cyanobacteriota bacterium]|nr:tetratricopeptide repeat protein [Cyanobacteriota bacterium]